MDNSKSITLEMVKCLEEAYTSWEAELKRYYNLLMEVLDEESQERLKQSQADWETFRDKEFEFIPLYFTDPGSYQGPAIAEHKMNIVRARALQLESYYQTIKEE